MWFYLLFCCFGFSFSLWKRLSGHLFFYFYCSYYIALIVVVVVIVFIVVVAFNVKDQLLQYHWFSALFLLICIISCLNDYGRFSVWHWISISCSLFPAALVLTLALALGLYLSPLSIINLYNLFSVYLLLFVFLDIFMSCYVIIILLLLLYVCRERRKETKKEWKKMFFSVSD